ncbi:MAG: hypothetical protein CVT66_10260 [Actinobacteria bacterium HGW-Actinobacteria-6]|jgi:hypothetical protein|nr:MAG: hypothetical protein CVT66_10260 [Actinobacteria bacterium HGW-Actinobacteria-6]
MGILGLCVVVLQLATGMWTIALARCGSDTASYARTVHWGVLVVFLALGVLQSRSGITLRPFVFFPDNAKTFLIVCALELPLLLFPGDYIRHGRRDDLS